MTGTPSQEARGPHGSNNFFFHYFLLVASVIWVGFSSSFLHWLLLKFTVQCRSTGQCWPTVCTMNSTMWRTMMTNSTINSTMFTNYTIYRTLTTLCKSWLRSISVLFYILHHSPSIFTHVENVHILGAEWCLVSNTTQHSAPNTSRGVWEF